MHTVKLSLNATGRRLLVRFHPLRARLTVTLTKLPKPQLITTKPVRFTAQAANPDALSRNCVISR